MAKKTLTANVFSVSSIKQLQKELEKYNDELVIKCRLLAEKLAERGVEIARIQIADLDAIFTGELLASIHTEYKESSKYGGIFTIITDSSHCAMVEFGTGQRGEDKPYPHPLPQGISWDYNVGKTIRQNSLTGRYYWFYPGQDGLWHYTEGMPSRPFMFNTSLELQKIVVKTAQEVFGK